MRRFRWRRRTSAAEDAERLLATANVARRAGGNGTLFDEPVIVARGKHHNDLELLDQEGHLLGSAVPGRREARSWDRSYELRDAYGQCVLIVRQPGPSNAAGLRELVRLATSTPDRPWWELSEPDDATVITVRTAQPQASHHPIITGPQQIGMLREARLHLWRLKRVRLWLDDQSGDELVRVKLARYRGFSQRVALVTETSDHAPAQLRKVALAAIAIADREFVVGP